MKRTLAFALVTALAPLTAQDDRIQWVDGTVTENVRVTDFTVFEIKWQARGSSDSRSSDKVAKVEVARVREAFARAFSSARTEQIPQFLNEAERRARSKDFLAQFGFLEAAERFIGNDQVGDGFQVLEKMVELIPNAGLMPELYRRKAEYYLGRGKDGAKDALTVARKFRQVATTQALPQGYAVEAEYLELMAEGAAGMSEADFTGRMQALLNKAEGTQPIIANRIRLQIARQAHLAGRGEEARRIFTGLLAKPEALDQASYARALVGMGHIHFKEADATKKELFRDAMMSYLRAYLLCPEADDETKAEALYHGAQSAEKWGETDSRLIVGRLRALLRRDFQHTTWGQR